MTYTGILAGVTTLLIIGLGFPLVIYGERLLGVLWWPYFMLVGALLVGASLLVRVDWVSLLVGVIGGTLIWASTELKEQSVRAELGWFVSNPKKVDPPFRKAIEKWRAPHL